MNQKYRIAKWSGLTLIPGHTWDLLGERVAGGPGMELLIILAHAKGGPSSRVCARKNPEFTPKYIIVDPYIFFDIFHLVLP